MRLFLDSIFGENGFQLFQPHVKFLFREAGLAVCEEAEGIGIVFLGEHPSLFCQLVEYFLGVCGERGGRSGGSREREGVERGGWVKREEDRWRERWVEEECLEHWWLKEHGTHFHTYLHTTALRPSHYKSPDTLFYEQYMNTYFSIIITYQWAGL